MHMNTFFKIKLIIGLMITVSNVLGSQDSFMPINESNRVPVGNYQELLRYPAQLKEGQEVVFKANKAREISTKTSTKGTIFADTQKRMISGSSLIVQEDHLESIQNEDVKLVARKITLREEGNFIDTVYTYEGRALFENGRTYVDANKRRRKELNGCGILALTSACILGAACVKAYSWIKKS